MLSYTYRGRFGNIVSLGLRALAIKWKRRKRRANIRRTIEKYKEDIKELMEDEDFYLNVLVEDETLNCYKSSVFIKIEIFSYILV